jgi:hypothetical protein
VGASYAEAVEEIKTSLAMAGNHLTRFTAEGKHVPPDLLPKMATLAERYVFGEHARRAAPTAASSPSSGSSTISPIDSPSSAPGRLREEARAHDRGGGAQFWMSIHFDDKFRRSATSRSR